MKEPAAHFFAGRARRQRGLAPLGHAPGIDKRILKQIARLLSMLHDAPQKAKQLALMALHQRGKIGKREKARSAIRLLSLQHSLLFHPKWERVLLSPLLPQPREPLKTG